MPTFPSDTQRGTPAWLTKLGPTLLRARYRTSVGDSNAANKVPLTIQGAPSQTASLIEAYDGSKNFLWGIDASGNHITNAGASTSTTTTVSINATDLVGTSAGQFGHANGYPLVAAPGAGKVIEFVSATMSYTFGVAAYTSGGNVTVNLAAGGAALTGIISAANSIGAASSKIGTYTPLAATGAVVTSNTGINLVAAAAFVQPGTATGTIKVFVTYRVHTL
jgi:hypothetical protein